MHDLWAYTAEKTESGAMGMISFDADTKRVKHNRLLKVSGIVRD